MDYLITRESIWINWEAAKALLGNTM